MDIAAFVREKRRALGLTQQQLADLAGVGLNFVYQLEKNKQTVQLDCLRLVLQALGFDLSVAPLGATAEAPVAALPRAAATPYLPWD